MSDCGKCTTGHLLVAYVHSFNIYVSGLTLMAKTMPKTEQKRDHQQPKAPTQNVTPMAKTRAPIP